MTQNEMYKNALLFLSNHEAQVIAEIESGLWDGFKDILSDVESKRYIPRKDVLDAIDQMK